MSFFPPINAVVLTGVLTLIAGPQAVAGPTEAFLYAETPGTFTSNAFLTETDPDSDVFLAPKYGAGVRAKDIKLGSGMLSYDFRAFLNDAWYAEFSERDGDAAGGAGRIAYAHAAWTIAAAYNPAWNYTSGFDEFTLSLHDLSLALAYKWSSGNFTLQPAVTVARRLSTNELAERVAFGGALKVIYKLSDRVSFTLAPNVTNQWYDTFPGQDREDLVYGLSAVVGLKIREGVNLNVGVTRIVRDFIGEWARLLRYQCGTAGRFGVQVLNSG